MSLTASIADIAIAEIADASIDYLKVAYSDTQEAIFRAITGGKVAIDRLSVMSAQIVDAVIGNLTLVDDDGTLYRVGIGTDGSLTATPTGETNEDMAGGGLPEGWRNVAGEISVGEVTAGRIVAQDATFVDLFASSIIASVVTASEAFITHINALDITGNNYLRMFVQNTASDAAASIGITEESILSKVEAEYVKNDDTYQEDAERWNTAVTQSANAVEWQANISKDDLVILQTWMRFASGGLEIGQAGSPFTARYSNDKIAFLMGDQEVAYLSNSKLYITQAEILTNMKIGKFNFVPQSNGNMSLVYDG